MHFSCSPGRGGPGEALSSFEELGLRLLYERFLSAGAVRVIQIQRVSALFLRQAFVRGETERLR